MAGLNLTVLMGNLTRDPELRKTNSGASVCNFDLAINRAYTTQAGEKKEDTTFMSIVVFGAPAENSAKYLKKGRPALVVGHLQNRSWEQDGQKRNKTEVVADRVQFLGGSNGAAQAAAAVASAESEDIPF